MQDARAGSSWHKIPGVPTVRAPIIGDLIITFPDVLEGDHRHQALPVSGVDQCGEAHSVVCATCLHVRQAGLNPPPYPLHNQLIRDFGQPNFEMEPVVLNSFNDFQKSIKTKPPKECPTDW